MLENELSGVQQSFREITVLEEKARNEEVTYVNEQTKRLEEYLNGIYGDWWICFILNNYLINLKMAQQNLNDS